MGSARRCGGGDGPCQCKGSRWDVLRHPMSRSFPDSAMQRRPSGREQETQRVSPPVRNGAPQTGRSGTSRRPAPNPTGAKRPPWAGRALAGGGSGAGRGLWPTAGVQDAQRRARAMAPARPRGTRAGGKVFCFPLSRPICSAPLQWPVRIGSFWVRDAKNCLEFKAAISKVRTSADGPLVLRFIRADG